jgi:uncharacterized membrane protein YebE (DUF533 family)
MGSTEQLSSPPTYVNAKANATLLLRAMIAAVNADYSVDEEERNLILSRLDEMGLSDEERNFLIEEIDHPRGVGDLVSQVNSPDMADQVYLVSLLATRGDTPVEQNYLRTLARRLNLDEARVQQWHESMSNP